MDRALTDSLPIADDLLDELNAFKPADAKASDPLFASSPTLKTFKRDLERAGVPYEDAMGRQADRKALRKTFCTHLKEAGVDIRDAAELMRHSDINLTRKIYTELRGVDLKAAVNSLRHICAKAGGQNGTKWHNLEQSKRKKPSA